MGQKKIGTRRIGRGNIEKKSCMTKKIVPESCKAVPLVIWWPFDSLSENFYFFFWPPVSKSSFWNWYRGSIHCMFFMCKRLFCQCWVFLSFHFLCESGVFVLFPASYVITYVYTYIYKPTCKYIRMWRQVDGRSVGKIWSNIIYGERC